MSDTGAAASADPRIQRYRQAERALWDHYGLQPTERFIELDSPRVRLRVLEVGSGEPVLFIHGAGPPGAASVWAPLVSELSGFRCLLLDRPGCGLSSAVNYAKDEYNTLVVDVLSRTVNALGLDRIHVVGWSIGAVWALRLVAAQPSRVGRIVLIGAAPVVPEFPIPVVFRVLSTPIGAVILRLLPAKPGIVRAFLRQIGSGPSLEAGHIPNALVEWVMALMRDTDTMRNDRAMVRAVGSWRGARPGLMFEAPELAAIQQPTLYVHGTADPDGTVDLARLTVGRLPRAELSLVDNAGHVPWFDDPGQVAGHISRFLAR